MKYTPKEILEQQINADDKWFREVILPSMKEELEYEMMRMIYIVIVTTLLEDIIHEHRVLWGTDSDSEPVLLRHDIKRRMVEAGYTGEMIDNQLESAVMTYQFIMGENKSGVR